MDVFQGSYKDGSNGTRDCRWFTTLYLILRIAILMAYAINTEFVVCISILLFLVPVFLTVVFHPHKSPIHNIADAFLLLILIAVCISANSIDVVHYVGLQTIIPSQELFNTFLCLMVVGQHKHITITALMVVGHKHIACGVWSMEC